MIFMAASQPAPSFLGASASGFTPESESKNHGGGQLIRAFQLRNDPPSKHAKGGRCASRLSAA
jgi:hypothetical protein